MSILVLLSAAVTAPAPVIATVAAVPVAVPAEAPDLSAPPSPHAPMRVAPRIVMSPEEALATVGAVNRSVRPRWTVSF